MRLILGDRLTGGVLASLVTYMLLFQGLVGAFAQGALAVPDEGSHFVVCSLATTAGEPGDDAGNSPLERAAHHCCAALCHAASSTAPILPATGLGPAFVPVAGVQPHFPSQGAPLRPSASRLLPEARAPPFISI